ncbi:MAG: FHA domain-containing protein [Bacteroidales bacterium]|nr:FHA domain-containing protein [Bacteroidales bacterium]
MADKTYVPGIDGGVPSAGPIAHDELSGGSAPKTKNVGNATVIPGAGDQDRANPKSFVSKDKPVLGFFYSVSKSSFGEYWPLYLGPNSIGRNGNCDIVLNEGTVSAQHATLIIHKEDDGEVYAGIKDNGSTHGVKVNGKSIRFDMASCNNMDIVKIGKNYELLFILVDAEKLGLKPAETFEEVKQAPVTKVDKRIITGPESKMSSPATYMNPFNSSRIANPSSSERTRGLDDETEPTPGGTRTR